MFWCGLKKGKIVRETLSHASDEWLLYLKANLDTGEQGEKERVLFSNLRCSLSKDMCNNLIKAT